MNIFVVEVLSKTLTAFTVKGGGQMRKLFFIIFLLMVFISPSYSAIIYRWVDKDGVTNFTDDPNKVPSDYRGQVQKEEIEEATRQEIASKPQADPRKKEGRKTDTYGRDESWWKEKVRPWKERLKEASENYEKANQKFIEEAEVLSQFKYGSRTQVKSKIFQLDRTNGERMKYEEQMTEAKEMLKKLAREAEESKTNPDWLN